LPKAASYPAYQNSILRKNFTLPFLKYKRLKLKLSVFSAGHICAMVTYFVTTRKNEVREHIPVPCDNLFQSILSSCHAVKVIFSLGLMVAQAMANGHQVFSI